jgi:hypothetical protein
VPALLNLLFSDLRHAALGPAHRTARMTGLLAGILLLSFADLYMTLVHLRGLGMAEANPVARGIMAFNSPAALVAWKAATVGLAVGILFDARRRRAAELAAMFCCAILVVLALRWAHYNSHVGALTSELNSVAETPSGDPSWVTISPDP